ncbi:RING finger protein nhl-1-like [Haliotis rufescens]|uniref:RING finger protein nhl-1-like n=1 Tax=Haliotis rufescens TaxID=6454 RepID=UPI00201EFD6A|nr:RING finger protein nhl-1-like [Haliotis rufescens]
MPYQLSLIEVSNCYHNHVDISDELPSTGNMEFLRRAVSTKQRRLSHLEESGGSSKDSLSTVDDNTSKNGIFHIPLTCNIEMTSLSSLNSLSSVTSSNYSSRENSPKSHPKRVSFSNDIVFDEPDTPLSSADDKMSTETQSPREGRLSTKRRSLKEGSFSTERRPRTMGSLSTERRASTRSSLPTDSLEKQLVKERRISTENFQSDDDSDSDSESESHFPEKFRAVLFNKFGAKRNTAPGIKDAKSVAHVYKGEVLVTDLLDSKVVLYERSGKAKRTFMTKESSEPWGATMTPDGHVAVTLRRQHCVALWTNDGTSMEVFGSGLLRCPAGLAVDKTGRVFVADEQLSDVFVFDQTGTVLFKLSDFHEPAFKQPRYVCCSHSGRIVVADSGNHCVKVFACNGNFMFKFGSYGKANGQFRFPYGVCVDQHDNIIVADHHNDRVVMFSATGQYMQDLVTPTAGLRSPCGVSVRCAHNRKLYITHGELRASEVIVFKLISMDSELSINVKHFV